MTKDEAFDIQKEHCEPVIKDGIEPWKKKKGMVCRYNHLTIKKFKPV